MLALFLFYNRMPLEPQGGYLDIGIALGAILLLFTLWFASGIFFLGVNQYAAVDRMGKVWKVWGPGGPAWRPVGFSTVHYFPTSQVKKVVDLPPVMMGRVETALYPNGDSEPLGFHDLSTERQAEVAADPLNSRFEVKVDGGMFYRFEKESLFNILQMFPSIAEMEDQLVEMTRIALHDKLGRITLSTMLEHKQAVSILYDERVRELTSKWGLHIEAQIGAVKIPVEVENANRSIAISKAEKQVTITRAEAEKERGRLVGEGRALGLKPLAEVMGTEEGRNAASLVLTTDALKSAELIVAPDLMGSLAGMRKIFK